MSKFTIRTHPAVFILETEIPEQTLSEINNCLDEKIINKTGISNEDRLIGQGKTIQQLRLDPTKDTELKGLVDLVLELGVEYIHHYIEKTKETVTQKKLEIDSLWSVHSYEGDYNPLHDHYTKTKMGISFTGWTKIPSQIGENATDLYNVSGACDGFINFTWGRSSVTDKDRLRPKQSILIKPETAKLLFFPSWLQHTVYPFTGKGERRTIAGNINCWEIDQ